MNLFPPLQGHLELFLLRTENGNFPQHLATHFWARHPILLILHHEQEWQDWALKVLYIKLFFIKITPKLQMWLLHHHFSPDLDFSGNLSPGRLTRVSELLEGEMSVSNSWARFKSSNLPGKTLWPISKNTNHTLDSLTGNSRKKKKKNKDCLVKCHPVKSFW